MRSRVRFWERSTSPWYARNYPGNWCVKMRGKKNEQVAGRVLISRIADPEPRVKTLT